MSIESIQARMAAIRALYRQTSGSGETAAFGTVLQEAVQRRSADTAAPTASQEPAAISAAPSLADARGSQPGSGSIAVTNAYGGMSARSVVRPETVAGRTYWNGSPDAEITSQAQPYMDIISDASATFGVPVNVIMSVIKCESDYSESETSHSGAMGLMQVMPFNAEDYGITEPYEPRQNIFCGTWEIGELLKMYDGDLKLAITAYNIGCGTIRRLGVTSSDSAAYRSNVPAAAQRYADKVLRLAGLDA